MVAVAASAGGVEALSGLVASFPEDFPAAVLVVLHIPPAGPTVLPSILARAGKLPARHPENGERLTGGLILVAPPDRHLAVDGDRVRLLTGPRENGHRPSADVLLRSVARNFPARAAGVVLSGTMDDGAAGLRAIRATGGLALVQDPKQAAFPSMPLAAIDEADPQFVGSLTDLADHLCGWLAQLPGDALEVNVNTSHPEYADDDLMPFTCPECGGTLWLHDDYGAHRFRCRVGHTFSSDNLLLGKQEVLESALWAAVVALEERADLLRRISRRMARGGRGPHLDRYHDEIAATEQRARFLRGLIQDLVHGAGETYGGKAHGSETA